MLDARRSLVRSTKAVLIAAVVPLALFAGVVPAHASRAVVFPGGCCFYNGDSVRTVVPPASSPQEGTDPFYAISGGAAGQKGVVGVAPGAAGYHGGHWAVYAVSFNIGVTPYLLTSESAVLAAQTAGDVTVTRVPDADFKCPIQP